MKDQVIYAYVKLGDTPLMIALTNPTKSDKENFVENLMKSLVNVDPGKVVGTLEATLETETKIHKDE
jgi:hypothetical protein